MDLGIAGRVALVTGASSGLGRAIAAGLVAEGARVAISSRSRSRIEAAAAEIGARPFVHDMAEPDAAGRLVADVEGALGPVDILVTNTGGPPSGDPLGFGRSDWEAAYRNLVLGPLALIEVVLPGMRARGWGRIVNSSSSAAREPYPALVLSNTHRAGMLAAVKTLARRVAGEGVTVNTLMPGRFATDRIVEISGSLDAAERAAAEEIPAGRLGRVEEYAAAAVFLCSAPASYVTGTTLLVDGGLTRSV